MKFSNNFLFAASALIWGSTWYAIIFQINHADPLVSVIYRFALAGMILLIACKAIGLPLKFSAGMHLQFILLGFTLFGLNYWLVYLAEARIPSGLVALIFSVIIFFNIFFNRLLLKAPLKKGTIYGGALGLLGSMLIFQPVILDFKISGHQFWGLAFSLGAVVIASLGNILAASIYKQKIPVIQTNAYGMLYGAIINFLVAFALNKPFFFEFTWSYTMSLVYLAVFGSVIAFAAYLELIGRIGPDRAVYVLIVSPVIALLISTFLEDFRWSWYSAIGSVLILTGNYMALKKKSKVELQPEPR